MNEVDKLVARLGWQLVQMELSLNQLREQNTSLSEELFLVKAQRNELLEKSKPEDPDDDPDPSALVNPDI